MSKINLKGHHKNVLSKSRAAGQDNRKKWEHNNIIILMVARSVFSGLSKK